MGKNKSGHFQSEQNGGFKRVKRFNPSFEQNPAIPDGSEETIYRILCPIRKIGSVIGKGGGIIKGMQDETGARIKVYEAVSGSDERVINIFSPATKKPKIHNNAEDREDPENDVPIEQELENMEPHCSAQDALLKVHQRICEDDGLFGDPKNKEDANEDDVVTARLLVPSNQIGCLLGKGGHIIKKLRSDTGANIRILPGDHLPPCAMSTDELVQISGVSAVVKKALYDISTHLHQNPRPPMDPINAAGQGFFPPGPPIGNMLPQGNPVWPRRNSGVPAASPMPWVGGRGSEPSGYRQGGFNSAPFANNGKTSDEFSMKILCSTEKIGGVIGKGGSNVKHLEQETGAQIKVADSAPEAGERVILVSSYEAHWDPRSPTIEAILQLQSKTNEISEKGDFTTRLLVPSSKVGCLLGQGGHIVNDMRRRTRADIRITSKEGKPDFASSDEELVQISGNIDVARDALSEIASRLRARSLEGTNAEPGRVGPLRGFGPPESFFERRLPPPGMVGPGRYGSYDHVQGGLREYERQTYPVHPSATAGYPTMNYSMEIKIPSSAVGPVLAAGESNIANIGHMSGAKVKLKNPSNASDCSVEIYGSSEQMDAAQKFLQAYISSIVTNFNSQPQQPPQQFPYQQTPQQVPYQQGPQDVQYQQGSQQTPYQQGSQQTPYQQGSQQTPYQQGLPQDTYQQVPQQDPYQQGSQQALYQQGQQQVPYQQGQQQVPYQQGQQQVPYQQGSQQDLYQQGLQQDLYQQGAQQDPHQGAQRDPQQQVSQQSPLQSSQQGSLQGFQQGGSYQAAPPQQQGSYQQTLPNQY